MDINYVYTAYTISVAAPFGRITMCKKARIGGDQTLPLPSSVQDSWENVQMLIIDEIPFMNKHDLDDLDMHMCELGNSEFVFGGFSVIFTGDFCQFEPVKGKEEHLLFST